MRVQMKKWGLLTLIWVFGMLGLVSVQASEVVIVGGYAREMPPGVVNSAVYLTIKNTSNEDVVLVNVSSERAAQVMIHQNTLQGDMMRMRPVEQIEIAAHDQFDFTPGGHHLMIMGLTKPLQAGQELDLLFQFKAGQGVEIMVPVVGNSDSSEHHNMHNSMTMKVQN